jgi:pimeloyl-ACP methyl ester carboxylesterase/DNA-binding CsgD family transcriptional regulator
MPSKSPATSQQIRFCTSFDGTRIAYAQTGSGPTLVKAPHWLTHLEYEWNSPIWRPWIDAFSSSFSFLRMDQRASGLSDRTAQDISLETWVRDFEAVVDASGVERFCIFGHSQGAAIAIAYAARHPERVTHLVLLGAYARGAQKRDLSPARIEELEAQFKLVEAGWEREDPAYRQMFSVQIIPGGTLDQLRALSDLQRVSADPPAAVRIMRTMAGLDVTPVAAALRVPTLVLHARSDRRAPFEEGRRLAAQIPDARFVPLESENHILLEQEPAFGQFFEEVRGFVRGASASADPALSALTARELEILERIGQGLDNAQIAAHLGLSEKTVKNHITRLFDKLGVENRSQAMLVALKKR